MPRETTTPSMACSDEDRDLIGVIASRVVDELHPPPCRAALVVDLTNCHANGCPLDLVALSKAKPLDLAFDVTGIMTFLDRKTGRLKGGFAPRTRRLHLPAAGIRATTIRVTTTGIFAHDGIARYLAAVYEATEGRTLCLTDRECREFVVCLLAWGLEPTEFYASPRPGSVEADGVTFYDIYCKPGASGRVRRKLYELQNLREIVGEFKAAAIKCDKAREAHSKHGGFVGEMMKDIARLGPLVERATKLLGVGRG